MNNYALFQEVIKLLNWWQPKIQDILGSKIKSIELFGSVALGDYQPSSSDVDVCTVVEGEITNEEGQRIGQVHDEMRQRFINEGVEGLKLRQVIEGPYVPIELTKDSKAIGYCYIAGGKTRKWAECNPITAFDRYSICHVGKCIFGDAVSFTPPTRDELIEHLNQGLDGLLTASLEHLNSSYWLAEMLTFLARSLVFWRDGIMLSKTMALQQEIEAQTPFSQAFNLALQFRQRKSDMDLPSHDELLRQFILIKEPVIQEIKNFCRRNDVS
jgi:predicted nucleotidyltransferase